MNLYLCEADSLPEADYEKYKNAVSAETLAKAEKMRFSRDGQASVIGEGMIRFALGEEMNIPPEKIEILKTEMTTTQELNDAKNKILGQLLMSLETNMAEADLLSWYNILGKSLNGFDEYKKMIMEVSQSDVIEIANKYFSKPYIYTVVKQKK